MNIYISSSEDGLSNELLHSYLHEIYSNITLCTFDSLQECSVFDIIIVNGNPDNTVQLLSHINSFRCAKLWLCANTKIIDKTLTNQFQKIHKIDDMAVDVSFFKIKPKILLVGNSTYLLGKNKGEFIDKFDYVVRFNNFNIEKHSDDIGTKVTHVVFNVGNICNNSNFKKYKNLQLFTNWRPLTDDDKYKINPKLYKAVEKVLKNIEFTCYKPSKQILNHYGFTPSINRESAGMSMILYYIHQCNLYDLHIINFGNGSTTVNMNSDKASKNHNLEREFNMIMNFHDNYALTFISF